MTVPSQFWPLLAFAILCLVGCNSSPVTASKFVSAQPMGTAVSIPAPLGLPPVPIPEENPPTSETIILGEKLFFSPVLSLDSTVACATCHQPSRSFTDGRPVSSGVGGKTGQRNSPTLLNAAYYTLQFWDGRADSLEAQALGPMMNTVEMAHTLEGVEQRCFEDPELRKMFEAAFGPGPPGRSPVSMQRITRALASYERTLLSGGSPFDRYQYGGERNALSPGARRGLEVFRDPARGNCVVCHTIEADHALFTDNKFHNLGVGMDAEGDLNDLGRYSMTRREGDQGTFRTPTLRNVSKTAPYMHDGSLKTLKEVVDFYVGGGNGNPYLDKEMKSLSHLTKQERADLVTFLESLTGEPQT